MKIRRLRGITALALVMLMAMALPALAGKTPAPTYSLTGAVTDSYDGRAVGGALVTATDAYTGVKVTVMANSQGLYSMNLPTGSYNISCSAAGYKDFVKLGFPVVSGVSTRFDIGLYAFQKGIDHRNKFTVYEGPQTCLACHATSDYATDLMQDVLSSVHFQLRTTNNQLDMPGLGSHGMLDRACGLPGTTLMANNFAGTATRTTGLVLDDGCGKCHIAYKPPYRYASAADAAPDIDCLICHAEVYGAEWGDAVIQSFWGTNPDASGRKVITLSDGSKSWSQDRSLRTARSVGSIPRNHSCQRCHEHGLSGYKRATPYNSTSDHHAAKGVECLRCHVAKQHKIARGNYVTDGHANEMPEQPVGCTECHGQAPHARTSAADLNRHVANVTCEACHIPTMQTDEGQGMVQKRAWAPFTMDPRNGQWQATPAMENAEYPGFADAYTEYFDAGTAPTVRWFNGKASMLAQAFGGYADRKSEGGCSQLFAFKPFTNGMLFDAGWLPGPQSDPSFDQVGGTWPFSMKMFYEQNWAKFAAFGFADAANYPTAQDYWNARPDMAMMLNNFPMMLQFDRAIYLSEADTIVGTVTPGPQNRQTYPGIAKAIDTGMGTMAVDMGYAPQGTPPAMVGSQMWSGSFFGMWVPIEMNPNSAFYGEIGSLITMSHGVKAAAETPGCFTCHYTDAEYAAGAVIPGKRIAFAPLGYPDRDGNGVVDPRRDIASSADKYSVAEITLKLGTSRKGQTVSATVKVIDSTSKAVLSGVGVNGTFTGPAGSGLPKTVSGTTGRTGTVTLTHTATVLPAGTYTFTVTSLAKDGVTEPETCANSIIK